MRGLSGLAWRGLEARPLRTTLTTAGVALGVAVLFAGLATNAGIDSAVDKAVTSIVGRADLRVGAFGETGLDATTVETITRIPGVAVAAPAIERRTYLGLERFAPGDALPAPVTIVGIDPETERRLHDVVVLEGRALTSSDELSAVVTATLARQDTIALGSRMTIQGPDAPVDVRVIGVLADDGAWGGASGRGVIVPLAVAQAAFPDAGASRVDLAIAGDTTVEAMVDALEGALQGQPFVTSSPTDLATSMLASTGEFAATTALIAAVALFAGAFLIFNTLSMTVVERLRELGLLRAAGATRRQLMGFILVQAAAIGIGGAILGVVLGAILAAAMVGWVGAVGAVPLGDPPITVTNVVAALAIGLAVTLAAAVEPARRASRVPPVEALKARLDLPTARRAHLRWLIAVFAVVGVVGLVAWPRSPGDGAIARSLVVYATLLVAVLAVPLVLPVLARIAGVPFALVARLEERIARASVLRDRSRATLTVGALTVGLAMIVALGGLSQYARATASGWVSDVVPGDLVLTSIFPRDADEGLVETLRELPGVASMSPIATFDLAVDGVRTDGAAMSGAALADDGRLRLTAGDRAEAFAAIDAGGAVILPAGFASAAGRTVGETIHVTAADGTLVDMRIAAIAERTLPGRSGESLLVGWWDADRLGVAGADAFAVRFVPDATPEARATVAAEARALALEPVVLDRIEGAVGTALDRVFGLFDALALVAVIVATLGIVNTLTMNVLERVREIGVLRAAGMTRRQVWRSVVVEAGLTGLVGAICGIVTGVGLGALMVTLAGGRADLANGLPWPAIGAALVLGVALAMLAAAYPARLASRVSIVRAVGYE